MLDSIATLNAQTELYGIFGNPVRHSLSPLIHNASFRRFRRNAVYLFFEIHPSLLESAFEAIRSLGIRGVNVTIPFKEAALNFLDEVPEDLDRCIGAINTVVHKNGKLVGYNTDSAGFLSALREELGISPRGKRALVLGAGGAARGVAFALAHAEADKILIHNRTHERARGLADRVASHFPHTEVLAVKRFENLASEKVDLVVNATSCGLHETDPSPMDLRLLTHTSGVFDLIYSSGQTPFLKQAGQLGLSCTNGLGMLVAQAALSFGLWTGLREGVKETMLDALKKCRL